MNLDELALIFPMAFAVFMVFLIGEPIVRLLLRIFGFYAIVEEGTCHVYTLFGNVVGVLQEAGLHWLWLEMGPGALVVNWLGKRHVLDMRLDQKYLRSLQVTAGNFIQIELALTTQ